MQKEVFDIQGMHCASCAANIERRIRKLKGVQTVQVSLLTNQMNVVFDTHYLTISTIEKTIHSIGFKAVVHCPAGTKGIEFNPVDTGLKNRFWISVFLFLPLLYIAMGSMMGLPLPPFMEGPSHIVSFVSIQFILAVLIAVINRSYFTRGLTSLFRGRPNMDSLIAIGAGTALVYGGWMMYEMINAIRIHDIQTAAHLSHNMYFESAGGILTLVTLGKYFESKSKRKTSNAIQKLISITPETAIVIRNNQEIEIASEEIKIGDKIIIKPGKRIPVDGIVYSGSSFVDESAMTGESMPVPKLKESKLLSATLNKAGTFIMQATHVGDDTTFAKVLRLVEEAAASKAPISRLADRISLFFVPVVIIIALITFVSWLYAGFPFEFAMSTAISVLIISCPCALGLATPVAIMVGTGKAASYGILIKSGEALEMAGKVDLVVFDKTGTITEGRPRVVHVFPVKKFSSMELIQFTASLEKSSEHLLAEAIVELANEKNIMLFEVEEFQYEPGLGVQGNVASHQVCIGNKLMMENKGVMLQSAVEQAEELMERGKTSVYVSIDGEFAGIIAIADQIKSTSRRTVHLLKKMGIETEMLTGDTIQTARVIQKQTGIEHLLAEVLPQNKEEEIRKQQALGKKVAMVGDGINDAPSLFRADVGIAIGTGSDIAIESADIVLLSNKLTDVVTALKLSRHVLRNIKQNLFWAFFYNIIGIPLAAGVFYLSMGWVLDPLFAAAAMSFSSVSVVLNALRISRFKVRN